MRIAMLLSGGVDSATALKLLIDAGHTAVTAYYLKVWLEDELHSLGDCPWQEDLRYARAVCEQLDVPLTVMPLQDAYWQEIVGYTLSELRSGRTPSPDVFCNQRIKFKTFLEQLPDSSDYVASGHYARVIADDGRCQLLQGVDPTKDQSYFLSHLSQEQLKLCLFPLGSYAKPEVRALAQRFGLAPAERPDSQGLCFLGKIRYREFIKFHLGERPGPIIDQKTGRTLGEHCGYWFHTIGQRKGLDLPQGPWFVVAKDMAKHVIYVRHATDLMGSRCFTTTQLNWISQPPPDGAVKVKIRHGPKLYGAHIKQLDGDCWQVQLEKADWGIAPGQIAVFYDRMVCLGGGTIDTIDSEDAP